MYTGVSYYVGQRERRARLSAQVPPTKGTVDLRDSSDEHTILAAATRSYEFRDMFQNCSNYIQIVVRLPYENVGLAVRYRTFR